ncbi:Axin-1 [Taenia solium]|eukprot:TsM_000077400 transcript=TsM_000077400 gene=TsM_000077400
MSTNYPVFEASTTTTPAPVISSGGGGGSGGFGHKHKRGVSSSRRTTTTGASTAAAGAAPAAAPSKVATMRDQNMAELDPSGFARLLNERLQRVVEDRAAMERLERLMSEVGNDEDGEETTEIPNPSQEKEGSTKTVEAVKIESKPETEMASATKTQQSQALPTTTESGERSISKAMASLSVASTTTATTTTTTTTSTKPSVLQRPWADRLLAAARVQHAQQGDNAQAILEDHCSRIWDTSADRTPTSSSGSGGDGLGASALRPRLDAPKKSSGPIAETARQAATGGGEEEEVEDDCVHPPLLQESSSPPSATTTTTTNSSTRFDFHQQVNDSQLADITSMRLQALCTSSPAASSTTGGGVGVGVGVGGGGSGGSGGLVVGYYLCDDPVPYRSQWPSNVITLGQFKHLVPKKGLFRFFFKTTSDEFDSGVVHQEISNDDAVLPLWEGKVVAKVERVEQ